MTREGQNQPDRTDASTAVAALSLRPASDTMVVVLVGSESTRFGPGYKALATLDGEPLIRRVVGMLRAMTGRPSIVVVRTADRREHLAQAFPRDRNVRLICSDSGLSGPLVGVTTVADTVTASWLLVAGCDMPLLKSHAVAALLECAARSGNDRSRDRNRHVSADGGHPSPPVIVPVSERGHEPLHVLYCRVTVRDNVSELIPDDGLGAFLNRLDGVEYVGFDALPEDVDRSMTDTNTHTELVRAAARDEARR